VIVEAELGELGIIEVVQSRQSISHPVLLPLNMLRVDGGVVL
jgi:hypothetical protein